jgi:hypothetical protein
MLFTCEGGGLRISFPSNMEAKDTIVDQYLVHQWAFDNTFAVCQRRDSNTRTLG